ncbi:MAG: hypothetical protein HOD63_09470 [Bacteroidetes bacterium]|jgi:regulator of cell morphogenesis and NO signaling|nr:hypothetical protein [Bacteroidota bacterium]MBT5531371.1 hypothetical protein [Cytophagia bacterium]MBT3424063.1 hypothetical protein [Bacteroidota bacterium]MBT3800506.1 hypothetical protein [Bacteroidota bacterium]MBT3934470.1 hypothetical protein [Bacteroidota bacterium]
MKSKTQENYLQKTLFDFKANDYSIYTYLLAKNIDFELHKDYSLQRLADKFGFDASMILDKLLVGGVVDFEDEIEFGNLQNSLLIEYLLKIHHSYLKESIPEITKSGSELLEEFRAIYPDLVETINFFNSLSNEVLEHVKEEELNLFPLFLESDQQLLENKMKKLEIEHDEAEGALKQLNRRCDGFNCSYADKNIKKYYQKLSEFSNKLYAHIHIEKDFLFPRLITI